MDGNAKTMNADRRRWGEFALFRQRGLSLVEMMVAIALGLLLLAAVTTLLVRENTTRSELDKSSRQIENGRYAIQLLRDDIQMAGYYGEYAPPLTVTYSNPDPCDIVDNTANLGTSGNLGWINASPVTVPLPLFGYKEGDAMPSCLSSRKSGTPVLVVRRAATDISATASGGTTYLQVAQCNTETANPFVLGSSGFTLHKKDCVTSASLRKYIVRIYYISSCDVCGTDTIPTLKVVEFVDGVRTLVPLVEGIEHLQFEYGIDSNNDSSTDSYTDTPTNWANVVAVRVSLLARNLEETAGYTSSQSYMLGTLAVPAANDHYKRHAYSALIRAVNPSGRRE